MLQDILFQYQNLVHKVDRICEKLENHYADHLVCKPGCSKCCQVERSVLSIEAYVIEEELKLLSVQRIRRLRNQHRKNDQTCPLLWKNRCVIYLSRPIICRTHGLPIFYHEAEITFIDYCRLNFTKLPENYVFNNKNVLDMRTFNTELLRLEQLYFSQVLRKKWKPDNRILLQKILADVKSETSE